MTTTRPKVLLCLNASIYDTYVTPDGWARLESFCEPIGRERVEVYSEDELIQALQGVAGLMKWGNLAPALTRRVMENAPDLRIVGIWDDRFGHGIDWDAARERGVRFVDVSNIASHQPVAEWVLAMTLMCLRNVGEVFRHMLDGTETWGRAMNADFVNGELTEKKVGLIGCGHIGQRLIELLALFRVDLKVYDPYVSEEVVTRLGICRVELDEVLRHAEILVVQVPHTPKTRGMIGERELSRLRKGAILINCCRGPVVDTPALIRRLEQRDLIAGLDVFDPEPLPQDSPLRRLPNAIITPHIAWYAPHALRRYFDVMTDEFERFFQGEPLRYELTPRMVAIRAGAEPL